MPTLARATDREVREIYRESHALWGAGLSLRDYRTLWEGLLRVAWARQHAAFYVWRGADGRALSSVKIYRPQMRVLEQRGRCAVISAVFTPRSSRRRGHATAMVDSALQRAAAAGDRTAFLFSDIGTAFYSRLGFRPLRGEEQSGSLLSIPGSADVGWSFREIATADLDLIERAHDASRRDGPIAFERDPGHWEFLLARTRSFFRHVHEPGVRQEFSIASFAGRSVGYVVAAQGLGQWHVREIGSVDGRAETMADLTRAAGARARRAGLNQLHAWLPPAVASQLEGHGLRRDVRRHAVPMIAALDPKLDLAGLNGVEAAYFSFLDQF